MKTKILISTSIVAFASLCGAAPKPRPAYELGQLISVLMPKPQQFIGWDYQVESNIRWQTDGFTEVTGGDGTKRSFRTGLARVHVMGSFATVLRTAREEIPWTVELATSLPAKFGPNAIEIFPGTEVNICFGSLYVGCEFAVEPSLKAAGISYEKICEPRSPGVVGVGYKLKKSGREQSYLMVMSNGGSGGTSTSLTIAFTGEDMARLCTQAF